MFLAGTRLAYIHRAVKDGAMISLIILLIRLMVVGQSGVSGHSALVLVEKGNKSVSGFVKIQNQHLAVVTAEVTILNERVV